MNEERGEGEDVDRFRVLQEMSTPKIAIARCEYRPGLHVGFGVHPIYP